MQRHSWPWRPMNAAASGSALSLTIGSNGTKDTNERTAGHDEIGDASDLLLGQPYDRTRRWPWRSYGDWCRKICTMGSGMCCSIEPCPTHETTPHDTLVGRVSGGTTYVRPCALSCGYCICSIMVVGTMYRWGQLYCYWWSSGNWSGVRAPTHLDSYRCARWSGVINYYSAGVLCMHALLTVTVVLHSCQGVRSCCQLLLLVSGYIAEVRRSPASAYDQPAREPEPRCSSLDVPHT